MNLTERLDALICESAGEEGSYFYRLLDLTREMAKRIEALEQRELGHIERVGKLLLDNDQG